MRSARQGLKRSAGAIGFFLGAVLLNTLVCVEMAFAHNAGGFMQAMKRRMHLTVLLSFGTSFSILIRLILAIAFMPATALAVANQWPMGGQNLRNTRNQPYESVIGPSNVGQLAVKWVFATVGPVFVTPAVTNGVVYFPDQGGNFYALDASNGALIWSHKISDWTGVRGDIARDDPAFSGGMLYFGDRGGNLATYSNGQLRGPGARVIAVNGTTGSAVWVTQIDSFPAAMITSSPVVFNGIVYVGVSSGAEEDLPARFPDYPCCSFQGSIVALKALTGKIVWKTSTMPSSPSNPGGYSGGSMWGSTPVVDPKRGSLYVGTGNNYEVPQDVKTCIANAQANGEPDSICNGIDHYAQDYFDSVLALDLNTGAIKWADRVEGYDAYEGACDALLPGCPSPHGSDYDFGAGPNLFSAVINGTARDVLGVGQKSGIYWAFNPDNGNLLWNRAVGPGSGLGGIEWGTAVMQRVYVPLADAGQTTYTLRPSGIRADGGSWAALDLATGKILWQTATPGTCTGPFGTTGGCITLGPASVANGVVYVSSLDNKAGDPTMFGLNTATGEILWSFAGGGGLSAGPAIVGNTVYWGAHKKLYAFAVPGT